MIKLIVFDWDDVITLGAKEAYFAAYHQALVEVGVHLTLQEEQKRKVRHQFWRNDIICSK